VTARQRDAIRWLEANEPASQFEVRRAGFQLRTFEALHEQGLIHARVVAGRVRPFHVYSTLGYQLTLAVAA
jgi:hypothetical protein